MPRSWPRSPRGGGTIPTIGHLDLETDGGPTLFGLPAEVADDDDRDEPALAATAPGGPPATPGLVVVKRADPIGAVALVLAGVAANASLLLSWWPGQGPSGLSLVRRGAEALDSGVGEAVRSVVWQPLAVVLCGGVLVLLGFLLLVPARAHRFVGVLALAVALVAAAAVVLLLADDGLATDGFGPGLWCAVAVPVLGVLGSLKAMLTAPLVTVGPR
ncbi:hypothetical protein ACFSHS_12750 [Blastococcus deserti]|uniref:Uncharacterized protein n=1 Tax=Blastococcus deserti TaxID=2259033 RepID=A0ABW4XC32_9ACTN